MKDKLFSKPKNILVSKCGNWLLDTHIAYHKDILPDEVTKAMGDETLLRAILKLNKQTFVKIENGLDMENVLAEYEENMVCYYATPWECIMQGKERTRAYLSETGDLALLPSFCTEGIEEVYGNHGNSCFLAHDKKMVICGWNPDYLKYTLVKQTPVTNKDVDIDLF